MSVVCPGAHWPRGLGLALAAGLAFGIACGGAGERPDAGDAAPTEDAALSTAIEQDAKQPAGADPPVRESQDGVAALLDRAAPALELAWGGVVPFTTGLLIADTVSQRIQAWPLAVPLESGRQVWPSASGQTVVWFDGDDAVVLRTRAERETLIGRARFLGFRADREEFVLFSDGDVALFASDGQWLADLYSAADAHPDFPPASVAEVVWRPDGELAALLATTEGADERRVSIRIREVPASASQRDIEVPAVYLPRRDEAGALPGAELAFSNDGVLALALGGWVLAWNGDGNLLWARETSLLHLRNPRWSPNGAHLTVSGHSGGGAVARRPATALLAADGALLFEAEPAITCHGDPWLPDSRGFAVERPPLQPVLLLSGQEGTPLPFGSRVFDEPDTVWRFHAESDERVLLLQHGDGETTVARAAGAASFVAPLNGNAWDRAGEMIIALVVTLGGGRCAEQYDQGPVTIRRGVEG